MRLTIKNPEKLQFSLFGLHSYSVETVWMFEEKYEWILHEVDGSDRIHVSINRDGLWDPDDKKWYYAINYLQGKPHLVSADWFRKWNNVRDTFTEIVEFRNLNKIKSI